MKRPVDSAANIARSKCNQQIETCSDIGTCDSLQLMAMLALCWHYVDVSNSVTVVRCVFLISPFCHNTYTAHYETESN